MAAVSIIIPTYNVEEYIGKCLDSLLCQTMTDFEIIVVDDGSKDRSHEIALEYQEKYPEVIRAYKQENTGQGGARNWGVELSKSEYILFVDSDDTVSSKLVESTYKKAQESGADMVVFDAIVTDEGGKELTTMIGCHSTKEEISLASYPKILMEYPCPWNKLYRRSLFDNPEVCFPTGIWYEDLTGACIFLANTKKIEVLHEPLYYYMQRTTSVMHSRTHEKNLDILKAMDLILEYYRNKGIYGQYRDVLESLAIYHILIAAAGRCVRGDSKSTIPDKLMEYMDKEFPNWEESGYMQKISKANQLKLHLLRERRYKVLALLYKFGKTKAI